MGAALPAAADPRRRIEALWWLGSGMASVLTAAAVVLALIASWSWHDALDAFVVSNIVIGTSFAACGSVILRYRPANLTGLLFLLAGLSHLLSAAAAPAADVLHQQGAPQVVVRVVMAVFAWSWPWSIALFIPLGLLLFPDGRLPSPSWRPVAYLLVATAPLFVCSAGLDPTPANPGLPPNIVALSTHGYTALDPLWALAEVRTLLALLAALVALGLRYRRGDDSERRQLSWLLLAGSTMLLLIVPWSLVAGTPVVVLFSIPLVPVAVTVAIVRHQLLDIRVLVPRVLAWLLLSALVLGCYSAAIAGLDLAVSARTRRSTLITVALVLLGAWLLPRVQALVDRSMYGDRRHPDRIATSVGERLVADDAGGLESVADAVRRALKLPYVALETSTEVVATAGSADHLTLHREGLRYRGELVGAIVVGLRAGERSLAAADEAVLRPLAAPVAAALRATELSRELQRSRAMIITAREEERRRLRHDLHDGLGPALTGIGLSADAAANFLRTDPTRVEAILGGLRRDADDTLAEVHRILENLAPSVVDELGLVAALELRARQLSLPADGRPPLKVRVLAPPVLPPMPAAVEIAAFRTAVEALTNIARHADAMLAEVQLQIDGSTLTLCIRDDGPHREPWREGIGLEGMRGRALELGGTCQAGAGVDGGRVVLHLPLRGS